MNWREAVPYMVALQQEAWERAQQVRRGRSLGLSYIEIGHWLHMHRQQAHRLFHKYKGKSPVNQWMEEEDDVYILHDKIMTYEYKLNRKYRPVTPKRSPVLKPQGRKRYVYEFNLDALNIESLGSVLTERKRRDA
jgi:hypothetical protein